MQFSGSMLGSVISETRAEVRQSEQGSKRRPSQGRPGSSIDLNKKDRLPEIKAIKPKKLERLGVKPMLTP